MHLCLGRRAPQRIGHGDPRPRPAFRSCLAPPTEARTPRKRVVFADTKGLSLTAVHSVEDAVGAGSEKDFCGLPGPARRLQTPQRPRAVHAAGGLQGGAMRARGLGFQKVPPVRIALGAWGSVLEVPRLTRPVLKELVASPSAWVATRSPELGEPSSCGSLSADDDQDGGGRGWGWDARVTSRRRRQRAGARTSLRTLGAGGGGEGGTHGPRRDLVSGAPRLLRQHVSNFLPRTQVTAEKRA
ncbi:hypothetical protein ABFV05_018785 [Capra hircus]